jgi:hypothetical protein
VSVQVVGHRAGWNDDARRLAALASIVLGNLAMLQWFCHRRRASGLHRSGTMNRAFRALIVGVCMLSGCGFAAGAAAGGVRGCLRYRRSRCWRCWCRWRVGRRGGCGRGPVLD